MTQIYTDIKETGIHWFEKIPEHWEIGRLKEIAMVQPSNVDKKTKEDELPVRLCNYVDVYYNDCITSDIDFMEATASPAEIKKFHVYPGDVIITKDSEAWDDIAIPAYISDKMKNVLCGYHLSIIRPDKVKVDGKYLFWSLCARGIIDQFRVSATGITRYGISRKWIVDALFLVPKIYEQKRIAAYLDKTCAAIDAAIEVKQKQLQKLYDLRKSTIHKAVTKGLDDSVEMKESGLGWLEKKPSHWRTCRIKDVLKFYNTERVPLSADVRGAMTEKIYDYYGASGIIDKVDDYIFNGSFILLAEDGANIIARNSPLVFLASGKFWVNNHAHILKAEFGNDCFFVYLLESLDYSLYVTGAAQPKLTKENLGKYRIIVPDRKEQDIITDYLDKKCLEINDLQKKIYAQISTLEKYRKSLIHECVTGKRRITNEDIGRVCGDDTMEVV